MTTQLDEYTATQIKAHWMCVALVRMAKELRKVGQRLKQEHDYTVRLALNDVRVSIALGEARCTALGVDFAPILEIAEWVKGNTRSRLIIVCDAAAEALELAKIAITAKASKHPVRLEHPVRRAVTSSELYEAHSSPDLGLSTVNNALEREEAAVVHDILYESGGKLCRRPDYFKAHYVTSYGRR